MTSARAALIESRCPSGFACPACGCGQSSSFRREGRLYFQCTACRHQCSVISGTIFEATKLGLSRWFLAMHLLTQSKSNVAALELMRHLGVCYKTAWLVKHKLMEVIRVREDDRQLDGRVETDDAYLGGERSGGKVGRGSELQPDVQLLPQRPCELPPRRLALLRIHSLELTFDVVDPADAFDRLLGYVARADQFVELALGMRHAMGGDSLRGHAPVEHGVIPGVLVAHPRATPRRTAFL